MLNKNKRYYILVFLSIKSKKIFFYVRRCINKNPTNVGLDAVKKWCKFPIIAWLW